MRKLSIKNYKKANYLNIFIYSFLIISIVIPTLLLTTLNDSLISQFLNKNTFIFILLILIQIYLFFTGSYYSKIKIDSYIINFSSSRTNSHDNLLDIKHDMLKNFYVKKSIFSWNTIFYINFIKKNNIYISRKFYFSLLNNNDKEKVISRLNYILKNNEWIRKFK